MTATVEPLRAPPAAPAAGLVVPSGRAGPRSASGDGYRELIRSARAAGLLDSRNGLYTLLIGLTIAAFGGGWYLFVAIGNSWLCLAVAPLLAVITVQLDFIGHDSGHQECFSSRRANIVTGWIVGNLLTGMSRIWWVRKHNAHHAHPNEIDRDPDIGPGVLAAPSRPMPGTGLPPTPLRRAWRRVLLVVLMPFELGMHLEGVYVILKRHDRSVVADAVFLAGNFAGWALALALVLSPVRAIAFFLVQQAIVGVYLRMCFAPNHKGMPIIGPESEMSFAERQVVSARNVAGGPLVMWLLGGLNFQIEHHLLPSMPRPNLRRAQVMVRAYCAEQGFPYREERFWESYRMAIDHLRGAGSPSTPSEATGVAGPA